MESTTFDRVSKLFAERKLSRRQAVRQGGAGLAAGAVAAAGLAPAAAQDATPPADATAAPSVGEKVAYLFLQSFRAGSIAPKEGEEGKFTLTLESGLGQTIYFSDRPLRDVGATPTPDFLDNLGFPDDNPPNAALLVEEDGEVDLAVLELFNPRYDLPTRTATYDVVPLAAYERPTDASFSETSTDLSSMPATFEAAHLFIDDCADASIACYENYASQPFVGWMRGAAKQGFCWNYLECVPCEPYFHTNPYKGAAWDWWAAACNDTYGQCGGNCRAGTATPG